jgi:hypothetical protein
MSQHRFIPIAGETDPGTMTQKHDHPALGETREGHMEALLLQTEKYTFPY